MPPPDGTAYVQVRIDKQQVLHHTHRRFAIIVEESVLRASIGGTDTMVGQLAHLLTASSLPTVSLGIIPPEPTAPVRGRSKAAGCSTTPRSTSNSPPGTYA